MSNYNEYDVIMRLIDEIMEEKSGYSNSPQKRIDNAHKRIDLLHEKVSKKLETPVSSGTAENPNENKVVEKLDRLVSSGKDPNENKVSKDNKKDGVTSVSTEDKEVPHETETSAFVSIGDLSTTELKERIRKELKEQDMSVKELVKKIYGLKDSEINHAENPYQKVYASLEKMDLQKQKKSMSTGGIKAVYSLKEEEEEKEETVECPYCGEKFEGQSSLGSHKRWCEEKEEQEEKKEKEETRSTAEIINKAGFTLTDFDRLENTFDKIIQVGKEDEITYERFSQNYGGNFQPLSVWQKLFQHPKILGELGNRVLENDKSFSWSKTSKGDSVRKWVIEIDG